MNAAEDPEDLLGILLDGAMDFVKADFGVVLVPDADPSYLRAIAARGQEAGSSDDAPLRFKLGEGMASRAFQEGLPKLTGDAALDPAFIPVIPGTRSEIALPILAGGNAVGVLRLDSKRPGAFDADDADLLLTATARAGQILQAERLKGELERKIKLKDILLAIARDVDALTSLKDVFEAAMRLLAERFGMVRGMLVLFGQDGPDRLSIHSAYNLTDEEISRGVYRVGEGVIGQAVERGQAVAIPDIRLDPTFLNRTRIKRRRDVPVSFIAAPFYIDGQVAGVLAAEKVFESAQALEDEKDLVVLVGSIIANKVRLHQRLGLERERLEAENLTLRRELKRQGVGGEIVCKNRKMQEILDLATLVADSTTSIMLQGESGTGKEVIARLIHDASPRREGPFVSINCAAIPENLLESELFGHRRGAFTGAVQDRKGKFQLADGGTVFLDEIGDMPMPLQAKLLRAVQEREIEPIGAERKEKIDLRFISATNRDLAKLISEGKFREDLYYRLNVVEISVPPLRERSDDIPFLAAYFIDKYAKARGRGVEGISPQALRMLQGYSWPGNVRELENVMERAILLCRSGIIEPSHLPASLSQAGESGADGQYVSRWVAGVVKARHEPGKVWDEIIGTVERELIQQAMLANNRNKLRTADFLGINRNTLRAKIEKYGLE
jgi:Nif-specific regulatory protein